jgi:hypothetical protein
MEDDRHERRSRGRGWDSAIPGHHADAAGLGQRSRQGGSFFYDFFDSKYGNGIAIRSPITEVANRMAIGIP